ncbi:hypothetical protein [Corallococcus sp. CA041A]|uniref:hypothetical protein n=1 Tax=Corallococcus sp. CA041A TaxID=2316727 RepID=UPI0011C47BCF|nr:hypothetical protein [Corallococcus sp. CA041A]
MERRFKGAKTRDWVATEALTLKKAKGASSRNTISPEIFSLVRKFIAEAKSEHHEYLHSGLLSKNTLISTIRLAQTDILVRSGKFDNNFGEVYLSDMKELQSLFEIIPPEMLNPTETCILNPTFGKASRAIGGADADLVLDDTLIEVKTTSNPLFSQSYFKQLASYFALSELGGVDGVTPSPTINNLGVYSARFGKIIRIEVESLLPMNVRRRLIRLFSEELNLPQPPAYATT